MQALHRVNGVVSSALPSSVIQPGSSDRHQDKVVVVPSLNGTTLPANNNNTIGSSNTDIMTLSRLASLSKTLNQSGGGGGTIVGSLKGGVLIGGGETSLEGGMSQHKHQVLNNSHLHHGSTTKSMKTEATPSNTTNNGLDNNQTSSSSITRDGQVQNFIKRHCYSLIDTRSSRLSSSQSGLENRVRSSLKTLRSSQLRISHTHTLNELSSHKKGSEVEEDDTPLMLTVDGSSNTSFNSSIDSSSNGSLLAPLLLSSGNKVSCALQQHLHCLESFIDEEATDTSSDEEEEMETLPNNGKTKSKNDRYIRYVVLSLLHPLNFCCMYYWKCVYIFYNGNQL